MGRKRTVGWGYVRAGLVSIETVIPLILDPTVEKVELCGHVVKVTSLRLQTFAQKGLECSACGLKATHFAVETKENGAPAWHLNLWADRSHEDKGEMLITHDHTLARGLGGKDHIDNVTTMCSKCNHQKSIPETEEYRRRKLLQYSGDDTVVVRQGPAKLTVSRRAKAAKKAAHDKPLFEVPMELAVRQYQAILRKEAKKKLVES